ncbi:MAG: hypothetical protein AB7S78_00880 [Candidatus Omnitrophota bacterium]
MKITAFLRINGVVGIILLVFTSKTISAGFMDNIHSATQKLQQTNDKKDITTPQENTQSPASVSVIEKNPILEKEQKIKSDPPLNEKQKCLAGVHGLYWRIVADKMENKMNSMNLSAQERKEWESDIAVLREAWENKLNTLPPTGHKDPRWYDARFTPDERSAMSLELSSMKSKATTACLRMKNDDKFIDGEIKNGEPSDLGSGR